ncbi:ERI1 exoribonuclease 2, partial [Silurus asotus]
IYTDQLLSYLIIIDFESTCWKEKNSYGQEIIEFPAVLMNTHTGLIESEFHSYVQPQEHPHLSSFCTELTGITQEQVEAGLPLQICLSRFTRWLHTLHQERDVVFLRDNTHTSTAGKPCAFLTWSDWDLGVCLQYECKRKQITKPNVLNSWIDLRATYRIYYQRKPKGLNGALQDLGIEFSGREHSGLDDARNTARLAWRMIRDGCVMKITKCVSRVSGLLQVLSSPSHTCTDFGDSGSYDDVIFEDTSENLPHDSASPECKTKPRPLHSCPSSSIKYPIRSLTDARTTPPIPFSIYTDQSHHSLSSSVFCVPSSRLSSTVNQSALSYISLNQSARSSYSIKQSHASFSINQSLLSSSKHLPLPPPKGQTKVMSAFPNKSALFSSRSLNQSCHTTLSVNQSASSTSSSKRLPLPSQKGGVKITSPLCDCGRRSRRLMVCNGGPNHGRGFYTCAKRRSSAPLPHNPTRRDSASHNNGCGFFKWESALIKHSEQN